MTMGIPLYTLEDFTEEEPKYNGLAVLDFEELTKEPEVEEIHQHSFYEILWVEMGASRQTLDFEQYDLTEGSIFFISPGQVHEFEEWRGLKGGTLLFTEEFILQDKTDPLWLNRLNYLDNPYANSELKLEPSEFNRAKYLLRWIQELIRTNSEPSVIYSIITTLLIYLQEGYNYVSNVYGSESILTFKALRRLLQKLNSYSSRPAELSDLLNMSTRRLNADIRSVTGKSTTEYVSPLRLWESKKLLAYSSLNIDEISYELDFFDSSHFARFFRQKEGMSPKDFQNTFRTEKK